MALNLDIIGKTMDPAAHTYDQDRVILYALGIGAGTEELEFVYEKGLKVFPTFAVTPYFPAFIPFAREAGLNMHAVLHGGHTVILHKPIPPSGTLTSLTRCEAIYDKADKGALIHLHIQTRNPEGGLIFENRAVLVDRSAARFGGDRGPPLGGLFPARGNPS